MPRADFAIIAENFSSTWVILIKGLVELRAAASLAPDNAGIYANLVEGLVYAEKYELVPEASEALRNVAEGHPERQAYLNLGLMYETIALACAGRDFSGSSQAI